MHFMQKFASLCRKLSFFSFASTTKSSIWTFMVQAKLEVDRTLQVKVRCLVYTGRNQGTESAPRKTHSVT